MPVFVIMIVVGGVIGGGPTPLSYSIIVDFVASMLMLLVLPSFSKGSYPRAALPAILILISIILVPLLQLIPLPVTVWNDLPGRGVPGGILYAAQAGVTRMPFSLYKQGTFLAALSLIVPAASFVAGLQASAKARDLIMFSIVLFAFAGAVLGVFQVARGGGLDLGIYSEIHDGYAIGFFANRNHEASLMLIAIPFSAHLIQTRNWVPRVKLYVIIGVIILFSLAVLSTISRAGLVLLPVSIASAIIISFGNGRDGKMWLGLLAALLMLIVAALLLEMSSVGSAVIHRFFVVDNDLRRQIWVNTTAAIKEFWPAGSGVGSFVPIYGMFEDLDSVNVLWVNHAHNDYLEIILETGIFGVGILMSYAVCIIYNVTRKFPKELRSQRSAGVSAILILLLHSLVDYPLRTSLLMAVFAYCNALVFVPNDFFRRRKRVSSDKRIISNAVSVPGS